MVVEVVSRAKNRRKKKAVFVSRSSCFAAVIEIAAASSHLGQVMLHRPRFTLYCPTFTISHAEKKANLVSTGNFLVLHLDGGGVFWCRGKNGQANCTVRNETTVTLLLDLRPLPTFLLIENPRLPWNSIICRDGANFPPSRNKLERVKTSEEYWI